MRGASMTREKVSKITCVASTSLGPSILEALRDSGIPETYLQTGKQVFLSERRGRFGFLPRVDLAEDRADIYRFYAPREAADDIARRVTDVASLALPGRGSLFIQDAELLRRRDEGASTPAPERGVGKILKDAAEKLIRPASRVDKYTAITCIVQRGQGDALARTILEMGLCVPVVSYGKGMGLRNKLGLLRITIPVDKEVIYFLVPQADTEMVENIAIHKARLDRPGQGFIYRSYVRAVAVNTRVSRGQRRHVATMEQVISAVDNLQGSTDWRRLAVPSRSRPAHSAGGPALACLSVICDEGRAGDFVRAAMDAGAGGATLIRLGYRDMPGGSVFGRPRGEERASHARETCDLIVQEELTEGIVKAMEERGLFDRETYGLVEITPVGKAVTYRTSACQGRG